MGGYNQNRSSENRGRNSFRDNDRKRNTYSGGSNGSSRNYEQREDRPSMTRAVCDECGRNCEVPFKPSGNKPVYCSDCFERQGNDSSPRSSKSYAPQRSSDDSHTMIQIKSQLDEINKKLDDIIKEVYKSKTIKVKKDVK